MDKYGLIGFPLKHSFSKKFFEEKFQNESLNAEYNNYEIENISKITTIIHNDDQIKGLNVTIPYKEKVIPLLDDLDETAKQIGAVNVIKICRTNGSTTLKGYNTDIIGFTESIKHLIPANMHPRALILGTGGASKAVYYGLLNLGIKSVFVSRSKREGMFTYEELNEELLQNYPIIVNSTPLGTFPKVEECPPIPYEYLSKNHLLYDLVYNPALTKFLENGQRAGAKIKNGYKMLELQALAAWDIWDY